MLRIYFATTSDVKFQQYKSIFGEMGVALRRGTATKSPLVEPQYEASVTSSQASLVTHPLRQAAPFAAKTGQLPYMVEDTTLVIEYFSRNPVKGGGLPGADTKNWWLNLSSTGVLDLMRSAQNRAAVFSAQIGIYAGAAIYRTAFAEIRGTISHAVRVSDIAKLELPRSNPYFFHEIFVPEHSNKTIAEMSGDEFRPADYRRRCAEKLMSTIAVEIPQWPIIEPDESPQLGLF